MTPMTIIGVVDPSGRQIFSFYCKWVGGCVGNQTAQAPVELLILSCSMFYYTSPRSSQVASAVNFEEKLIFTMIKLLVKKGGEVVTFHTVIT